MPNDQQQIRDVIDTWMRATATGDVDQVLKLMHEDAVFLVTGQAPMRGREVFASGLKEALQKFQIDCASDVREINVSGDWAYCWNYLTVTMTPRAEGSPLRREGNVLTIFRKDGEGNWVLFRDANLLGG